ncbi:MAG: undecaprenyldiphospho-muramoylpentapeptide beta-N-acetylglucosaminyltransferase [Gammaproteobacteria bacterium]|nr:undecaprenyldiphospho-muramoylpentapeptide beta-N-acetylglucosaminyltransferase [Gammaproteobacteria bacterium]
MPKVLFTGGGTAGHVIPNIAIIDHLVLEGYEVGYVGEKGGIEEGLITKLCIPFFQINAGKVRRYFSISNFLDPFKVIVGIFQGLLICLKEKPNLVFSKGGYVSIPLVISAWILRIPVIAHESDVSPGLANKIASKFCRKICLTFESTLKYVPHGRGLVTGTPVRESLFRGNADRGRKYLGLRGRRPILLVFGGSKGAMILNQLLRNVLEQVLSECDVVHITGLGNLELRIDKPGYVQKEFVDEEFGDVMAASSAVVSRAGANSLYELLALKKPHLLIPLSEKASRGDQVENAKTFYDIGLSRFIEEDTLSEENFLAEIIELLRTRNDITEKMASFEIPDAVTLITKVIKQYVQ